MTTKILTCIMMLMIVVSMAALADDPAIVPDQSVTTAPTAEVITDVEPVPDPTPGPTPGPWTWAYLASIAGATAATLLIVQFLKVPLDKVWRIPTRAFVYIIAFVILTVATGFTQGLTPNSLLLCVLNAFIVALAAYGGYEVSFARLEHK